MQTFLVLCAILALGGVSSETPRNFTNHKIVAAKLLAGAKFDDAEELSRFGKLHLWSEHPSEDGSFLFSVDSQNVDEVRAALREKKIFSTIKQENLQALIDEERGVQLYDDFLERPVNSKKFEAYEQIKASLRYYEANPHSLGHISSFVVGQTYEGRDIVGIKISNSKEPKPIAFLECGIHAREWASVSTCLYIIDQLATEPEMHRDLLEKFEFHIVPTSNPDGYEYTRNVDRLWRKNRKPTANRLCPGTDLNRNFKAGPHCGVGTSNYPCSDVYCGSAPFSEPETEALSNYLAKFQDRVEYYVSLHAYGLMWMFPYSYTERPCADHDELYKRGMKAVRAIEMKTGTKYKFGPIAKTIYAVTGSSIDWAYDTLGIKKSYVMELQPSLKSDTGFILSARDIVSVASETLTGLRVLWLSTLL